MAEFRWIKVSLFLILVLQFTAAATGLLLLSYTVRVGDEVTLSCENVKDDQDHCDRTTWLFSESGNRAAVELVRLGQIGENAKSKSDRLSVTANCSLVIKNVTVEDVGRYICRQYKNSGESLDTVVYLSLINMTEQKDADKVTVGCTVSTYRQCGHTVKWLFQGQDVDKLHQDMKTQQSPCSASVNFQTSHYIYTSRYDLLKCEVTDGNTRKVQLFPFRLWSSGEKPGWWRVIIVSVGLAALIIIVVAVNIWTRTKGKETQMDENTVHHDEDDGTVNYENITSSDGV